MVIRVGRIFGVFESVEGEMKVCEEGLFMVSHGTGEKRGVEDGCMVVMGSKWE